MNNRQMLTTVIRMLNAPSDRLWDEELTALRTLARRFEEAHAAALYWRDVAGGKRAAPEGFGLPGLTIHRFITEEPDRDAL